MKTAEKVELGNRIKSWREHFGKSREELAAAVGVSEVAVIQWETGVHSPTHVNLAAIAEALGITLSRFWGRIPPSGRRARKAA